MARTIKIRGGSVGSVDDVRSTIKKKSGGGARYMQRVPKDAELSVRFLTEPDEWIEFYQHFEEGKDGRGYFPCVEGCEFEDRNGKHSPSQRYVANVLLTEEGRVAPLEMAMTLAEIVLRRYDKFSTLLDRDYDLSREGTGRDTKYDAVAMSPSNLKIERYEKLDLWASVEGLLEGASGTTEPELEEAKPDPDEEDDEPPARTAKKKTTVIKKKTTAEPDAAPAKKKILIKRKA